MCQIPAFGLDLLRLIKGYVMKPFKELTYLGQARRLRRLAQSALAEYGLADAQLKLISHYGENTTFRVNAPQAAADTLTNEQYVENNFLLRIHQPGRQSAESIASELAWLAALRREAGLVVPEPMPSLEGKLLVQAAAAGVPERRNCSLLRWMRGRFCRQHFRLSHFGAVGRLMARLHNHAAQWEPPPGFVRRHWDWEGLFGDNAGFDLSASEVWALLPYPYHDPFAAVADQMREVMDQWDKGADDFGLIHADLGLGDEANVLFCGGEARAIDFDDCGFGYWVYDLATALCHWQEAKTWPAIRDAVLQGCAQVRPLPESQLVQFDLFMAARHVSEILWAIDRAQVNSSFREELQGWTEWAAKHVGRFLDSHG